MPLFPKLSKKQPTRIADERNPPKRNTTEIISCSSSDSNFVSSRDELGTINSDPNNVQHIVQSFDGQSTNGYHGFNDTQKAPTFRSTTPPPPSDSVKTIRGNPMCHMSPPPQDTKLVFHCQLAHGSPTGLLYGFTNLRELYQRAAECYEIPVDDILYCTVNTHKADMEHLLGGHICLDDFIFIHLKGQKKEVEIVKDENSLGVTITDNGAGKAFIKRIKSDSVVGRLGGVIRTGDHIERINSDSMVGKKHVDVANYLKMLPIGCTFTIRLIEPLQAEFSSASSRSSVCSSLLSRPSSVCINRTKTLRFKATGKRLPVLVESGPSNAVIDRINAVLESYLGIHDAELAWTVWDLAKEKENANNPVAFLSALKRSELAEFRIPDDVAFDLWAGTKEGQPITPRQGSIVTFESNRQFDDEKTLTRASFSTQVGR